MESNDFKFLSQIVRASNESGDVEEYFSICSDLPDGVDVVIKQDNAIGGEVLVPNFHSLDRLFGSSFGWFFIQVCNVDKRQARLYRNQLNPSEVQYPQIEGVYPKFA